MAHVRFLENFQFYPRDDPRVHVAYRADRSYTVPQECADQAIAEGKAVAVKVSEDIVERLTTAQTLPPVAQLARPRSRAAQVRNGSDT